MAKTKISEFSSTAGNNTDIDSINIAEGCAPSGINNAIRELMAQLKDFQTGAAGDSFNGPVGTTTAAAGAFTNLTASGTLGVTGVATLGNGAVLGTPASVTLTNGTGLPIATGVSGLGTGIATALAVNVGSAGAPVINGGALGTPSSGTVTNLTGTASININGTVGATTATTGAFTTLTTSSTVTHNGGTANGVAYLNGSKVLTTGSALTFDGTNFGLGTASPSGASGRTFAINGGSGQARLALKNTSSGDASGDGFQFVLDNTAGGIEMRENLPLYFTTNNTERARIDSSGNLGIGTSSPQYKLTVDGVVQARSAVTAVTIANGATATVITPPRGFSYINVSRTDTTTFGLLLLVFRTSTALEIVSTVSDKTSASYSASASGTALQITNSSGSEKAFYASCVCIAFGTGD